MIPSVCLAFGITRWSPKTRESYIFQACYIYSDSRNRGFQTIHQPAIWMGKHSQVVLIPDVGPVQHSFQKRGLQFEKKHEKSTPYVHEMLLETQQMLDHDYNATAGAAVYGQLRFLSSSERAPMAEPEDP